MDAVANLNSQLRALENFFAVWPLMGQLARSGKLVIHDLRQGDEAPRVSFTQEADAGLAYALFRERWCAEAPHPGYVRFFQMVLGVEVSIRFAVANENLNSRKATLHTYA